MKSNTSLIFFFIFLSFKEFSLSKELNGVIKSQNKKFPINNAYVINLNNLTATNSNISGHFNIEADLNDTLIIYSLGYDFIKVRATQDWIKANHNEIQLNELTQSVDHILSKKQLTGILEIDLLKGKKNDNVILSISGLHNSGYELGGSLEPDYRIVDKTFLLKKLKGINKNAKLSEALRNSFRRELACSILNIKKNQLVSILEKCEFSDYYILYASDLQILQGIKNCYNSIQ